MLTETEHRVAFERCTGCGGLWFDRGEIQDFVRRESLPSSLAPPDSAFLSEVEGIKRSCTRCGKTCLKPGRFNGVAYRRCSHCGGIFIRKTEIAKILGGDSTETEAAETGQFSMVNMSADVFVLGSGDLIADATEVILNFLSELLSG
jgi:Zn-finger nucleic acid-binding protein